MADESMNFEEDDFDEDRWQEGGVMSPYDYEEVLQNREKSWLLRMPSFNPRLMGLDVWFPKRWETGMCVLDEEKKQIWVPRWLAEEKGLI